MKLFFISLIFISFLLNNINAQDTIPLRVIAKNYGDSIVLRWAPDNAQAWILANQAGYTIIREGIVASGDSAIFQRKTLTSAPLKPASPEGWKSIYDRGNRYALIAYQVLYGKDLAANNNGGNEFGSDKVAGQSAEEARWTYALLAADLSAPIADGLALRYTDKDIQANSEYRYYIYSSFKDPNIRLDTARIRILSDRIDYQASAPSLTAEGGERIVSLSWNNPQGEDISFSGFWLERGDASGNNFKNLLPYPILANKSDENLTIRWTDSVTVNYEVYTYRLTGINAFGEKSLPSEIIRAYGMDKTAPAFPVDVTAKNNIRGDIEVSWKTQRVDPDLGGFLIERGYNVEGPFELVTMRKLPKSARTYVDTSGNVFVNTYYRVLAVDTSGNMAPSYSTYAIIKDTIAPAAPVGLTGTIDSNGLVRISWKIGGEPDLYAYRVFFSNLKTHEYTNLTATPLQDTVFTYQTTLETSSRRLYFKVAALDRSFNHSQHSQVMELLRPDKVAPRAPVFSDYEVENNHVLLAWFNPKDEDLNQIALYRKTENTPWKLVAAEGSLQTFKDSIPSPDVNYAYSLKATDISGNQSEMSEPLYITRADRSQPTSVKKITAVYNEKTRSIRVQWQYPLSKNYYFVLYRSLNGKPLSAIHSVEGNELHFDDKSIGTKGVYKYAVKVVYQDGRNSELGTPVEVKVE